MIKDPFADLNDSAPTPPSRQIDPQPAAPTPRTAVPLSLGAEPDTPRWKPSGQTSPPKPRRWLLPMAVSGLILVLLGGGYLAWNQGYVTLPFLPQRPVNQGANATPNPSSQASTNTSNANVNAPTQTALRNGEDLDTKAAAEDALGDPEGIYGGELGAFLNQAVSYEINTLGKLVKTDADGGTETITASVSLTGYTFVWGRDGLLLFRKSKNSNLSGLTGYDATYQPLFLWYSFTSKQFVQLPNPPGWPTTAGTLANLSHVLPSISEGKMYFYFKLYSGQVSTETNQPAEIIEFNTNSSSNETEPAPLGLHAIGGNENIKPTARLAAILNTANASFDQSQPLFAGLGLTRYQGNDLSLMWDSAAQVAMGPMDQDDCDSWNMLLRVDLVGRRVEEIGGTGSFNFRQPEIDCNPAVWFTPSSRWLLLYDDNRQGKLEFQLFGFGQSKPLKTVTLGWPASQLEIGYFYLWNENGDYPAVLVTRAVDRMSARTFEQIDFNSGASGPDSDRDWLLDSDEPTYQTDPKNPDSDRDGFIDGDEVKNGYNPNGPGKL